MRETILSIPVKRIRLGAQLFLAFSLVAYFFLFQRSSIADSIHHLRHFDPRWFALGLALVGVDQVLAGTRIMLFARRVEKSITFGAGWRSCMVHVFLAGVTPSQTGGAAAQVYVLYLEGMKALDATVACFVGGFITTVIVLMSGATFLMFRPELLAPELRTLARVSFGVYVAIIVMIILTLTHPEGFKRVLSRLLMRIPKVRNTRAVERVSHTIDNYHDLMTGFFLRGKAIFFVGLLLTALIYVNKFLIGWVVLRGLGLQANVFQVLYLQIIPLLIFYFSPTPGSSGLAEVSTMAAMAPVLPRSYSAAYVLVWRFFTLVVNMITGAGVVMTYLSGKRGRRPAEPAPENAKVAR
jgi:uncharacterized protein (TIRG00374 family)